MPINQISPSVQGGLRATQLIVFVMLTGVLGFAVVVYFLRNKPSPELDQILAIIVASLTISAVGVFVAMGSVASKRARALVQDYRTEEEKQAAVLTALRSTTLIRAVMAEGAGLFAVVSAFISGNPLFFAAIAIPALLLLALLPVRARFESLYARATGAAL